MSSPSIAELAAAGESTDPVRIELGKLREGSPAEYVLRFAFGAAVSIVAALVTSKFGPHLGGLFLAFPAILPASLTLIEKDEGNRPARADIVGAVLGSCGMLAFALVAFALLPRTAPIAVLALALLAWVAVSGLLFLLTRGRPK